MAGGNASVFKTAMEGLEELRESCKDGDLLAAAMAVAENGVGYGTSEDRENIIIMVKA